MKELPSMYHSSINKEINNNERIYSTLYNDSNIISNKSFINNRNNLTVEQKIQNIFNSPNYIYKIDVVIVTDNNKVNKELSNPSMEIDPTGVGDAFFGVFISEYIKNNYIIDYKFIDSTFEKATKLTKKVVKKFGARGHIQNLYKIKKAKFCFFYLTFFIKNTAISTTNIN